ncbi:MAG: trypsin-like peptidase domain-containing protein [Deltaproteobacteria bacterium]|nr:trypsin-like peptidase domain-containing protein [Deltaproteobacteria bacterium]
MPAYRIFNFDLKYTYQQLLRVARLREPGEQKVDKFPEELSVSDLQKRGKFGDVYVEVLDAENKVHQLRGDAWLQGAYAIARHYDEISDGVVDGKIDEARIESSIPIESIEAVKSWLPLRQLLLRNKKSIVRIDLAGEKGQPTGNGSGVVYQSIPNPHLGGYDNFIVTNLHVVKTTLRHSLAYKDTCILPSSEEEESSSFSPWGNENKDLKQPLDHVLFALEHPDLAFVVIHTDEPLYRGVEAEPMLDRFAAEGRKVVIMGSAAGVDSFAQGTFVRRVPQDHHGHILIDGALNPGHSGGAIFDLYRSTLLGVNVAKVDPKDVDNMGLAIDINEVVPRLDEALQKFQTLQKIVWSKSTSPDDYRERMEKLGVVEKKIPICTSEEIQELSAAIETAHLKDLEKGTAEKDELSRMITLIPLVGLKYFSEHLVQYLQRTRFSRGYRIWENSQVIRAYGEIP